MKKFIFLFLFFTGNIFAATLDTDISLFAELSSAYNSGFYPGAVQYAVRLENEFPDSASLGEALLIKGESQVRLNLFSDACLTLEKAAEFTETNAVLQNNCNFWLARAYDGTGSYSKSLEYYYEYCRGAVGAGALKGGKVTEGTKYYAAAVLESGRIFYKTGAYSEAVSPLEYVVENGVYYSSAEYADGLIKLMDSYTRSGASKKAVALYNKISPENFEKLHLKPYVYYLFMQYAGDAYLESGEYKKAYDIYCTVLKTGDKALASNALKKAYNVSSAHRAKVGAEPGTVLADAQKYLADSPELLGEFWTRLGADAYEAGDYKKAVAYFDEAEKNAPIDLFLFAALYRAQIAAGKIPDAASAAVAEQMINNSRNILNEENSGILYRESNILLARYAAVQGNWESVRKYGQNVVPPDSGTDYYLALSYYNTGDYDTADKYLKGSSNLHALVLAKLQNLQASAAMYSEIAAGRALTDEGRLNYAKVLLYSGRYRESQIESAKCALPEAKYVLGLSQFNTWSWPYAEDNFRKYLASSGLKDGKTVSYALFYLGYSQYRQGKSKEAYDNLSSFVKKYPQHELYWNAQMAAANSAVQNSRNDLAAFHAENAVKFSSGNKNLEEAVLLCAEIYIDSAEYQKAYKLLAPYSKLNNEFGMKAMYKTGQIYEKLQDFSNADATYKSLSFKFNDEKLAEEAMYRRGEMYYNNAVYDKAVACFGEYSKKYPSGSFVDAAWYFTADSYVHTGNTERAVLQNQALVKKFPESTFVYSSCRNLIDLYREKGDYPSAIEYAKFLVDKYGDQARNDGISEVAADLQKLHSGKSEQIVKKEAEFKRNGEFSSAAGRKTGTELVALYAASASLSRNAVSLAEQLLPLQKKNLREESLLAAENAEFLGKMYRRAERNSSAAQMYLLAAEYYRMNNRNDDAAASLYGAYDSFRAAGMGGDASETARTLKNLYPESRQAKNIRI